MLAGFETSPAQAVLRRLTLYTRIVQRGTTDAYAEKQQYMYGLSDWFITDQSRLNHRQSRQRQVNPGQTSYDVSLANSRAPGVWFVLVLIIVCDCFGPKNSEVFLILAEVLCFARGSDSSLWEFGTPLPCG